MPQIIQKCGALLNYTGKEKEKKMGFFDRFKKKEEGLELKAYVSGRTIPLSEVADEVFSSGALGKGMAIIPENGELTAPCTGEITMLMEDSGHAVGMKAENNAELLIHVGLDTVILGGEGFHLLVKEGDKVAAGDLLLTFDRELIQSKGLDATCVLVNTNPDDFPSASYNTGIDAVQNKTVIGKL